MGRMAIQLTCLSYCRIRFRLIVAWCQRGYIPPAYLQLIKPKGPSMQRTATLSGNLTAGSNNTDPISGTVKKIAQAAHETTERIANQATTQVDRSAGAVHRAVDSVASAATSAAEWASTVPEQAKQVKTRLTGSASASIRARPIAAVAGALAAGYLLGRLARL
jgi:hypothetical protein